MKLTKKKKFRCAIALCLSLLLTGCSLKNKPASMKKPWQGTDFAMGTVISQNIYGDDGRATASQVLDTIKEVEKTISWRIEDSDIAAINRTAGEEKGQKVNKKTAEWIKDSTDVYEKSNGALDITVGPVARLWDIGGENPRVPTKDEIEKALSMVDGSRLKAENQHVYFGTANGQLDLGAVGKGIACDEIAAALNGSGKAGRINGTFSVGGSVLLYGRKPDQSDWKIGVQDPKGEDGQNMGVLAIRQEEQAKTFISTSGDYEKYIEEDGVRYHHIMDPRTGYPAESGLISVTILSESGFLSDALSTACFVSGLSEGKKLAEAYGAEAIFIDKEKNVYTTTGVGDYFTILEKEYKLSNETNKD